jgi:hypothetical protein
MHSATALFIALKLRVLTRSVFRLLAVLLVFPALSYSRTPALPPAPQAGISLVQTTGSTNNSSSGTISQSFAQNNVAGDLIVVAVSWGSNAAPSITTSDTQQNTYSLATSQWDSGNNQGLAILYAPNIRAGANAVTVSLGNSDDSRRIVISEYSGIATTNPLDVSAKNLSAQASTSTNGATSNAATTTTNGDLIFGAVMDDSGNFGNISAGTGFTERFTLNNVDTATEDTIQPSIGSVAATFTFSLADRYLAAMAAFRPATQTAAAAVAGAVGYVQGADQTNNAGSPTISQAFPSPVTSGNTIIVAVSWGDNTAPSISASDTLGNAYSLATTAWDTNHNQGLSIFYSPDILPGADTVTVNFGQSDEYRRIIVSEYSGIAASSPLDTMAVHLATASKSTNGATSTSGTTTTAGDLIFGAVMDDSGHFGSISAGTGFTRRFALNNVDTATEDSTQTTPGPIAATFTFSLSDTYLAEMAAFRPAATGTSGSTPPSLTIALACTPTTLATGATASCTVSMSQAAPTGGGVFSLSTSNTSALSVPTSLTVLAGASSASFSAVAGSVTSNQAVIVTAVSSSSSSVTATNSVTVTPPPAISVAVSPSTATVSLSQSASFTATLQNDSQNKGVLWNVTGSGCSGSTCGVLSNITPLSVTYTAPAVSPTPASVVLSATSIADGTKSASSAITITTLPPPAISVTLVPPSTSVQVSASTTFTASLQNDTQNKGVTWTLSGNGCSGSTCGTLTVSSSTAVIYNAPALVPRHGSVNLKATSVADTTKSATAVVTITAAPPPISVSVSPTTASVQVSQSASFSALVQNDSTNSGVSWTLSGSGCSGNSCGILSNITTTAVTYNAPATAPAPDTVTLTATSVANSTESFAAVITVTGGAQPISVSVNPTTAALQASQSTSVTATVLNDSANEGVTWSLSGSGCSGSACGALSNITSTTVTYTAPSVVPSPPSVSLTATSVANTTQSASTSISISSGASQLTLNGVTLFILNTQSGISQPISATKGNLLIVSYIGGPGDNLLSVSDNQGNSYVSTGQHGTSLDGGECWIFYAANAKPGVTSITFNTATNGNFDDANVYDVSGAASSPLDSAANISNQHQSSFGNFSGASVTASTSGGIIVANLGIESNTITGTLTPWVFDPQDENNGWAHLLNSTSGTFAPTWTTNQSEASGGVGYWGGTTAAFKANGSTQ